MANPAQRYAVVTGSNKGIGLETVRQLASNGIIVVLTSRDEKRGLDAVETLKADGLSDKVVFHQLDVTDPASIASLADFIRNQFGKLDILVNNAGFGGLTVDSDAFTRHTKLAGGFPQGEDVWNEIAVQTFAETEECLNINYYGAKRMVNGLLPLLQLSDSPRIVNVSSFLGLLMNIPNEEVKKVLNDVESLTEEQVDELLNKFLKDFKDGSLEKEGWPTYISAYIVSKACLNAYTRILAKKYPTFLVNCGCPGFIKTDMTCNNGLFTTVEGAQHPVRLALLPHDGPSGCFFSQHEMSSF